MNDISVLSSVENSPGRNEKRTKASIWKEVIDELVDPTSGMEESERAEYDQKILQKLKSGKRLTSEEMNYLRIHNPELYRSAMRVEVARKSLQERLKNCRSKEEVQQVVFVQMEVLRGMKDDPDGEYITAMVKKEIDDFRKSSAYAKLPLTSDKREKKTKKVETYEPGKEEEIYSKVNIFTKMQFQCEMISQMTQAFI